MPTIAELAGELDVTADDVQAYVAQLVCENGDLDVIAQHGSEPGQAALTEKTAQRVRVRFTH